MRRANTMTAATQPAPAAMRNGLKCPDSSSQKPISTPKVVTTSDSRASPTAATTNGSSINAR